MKRFFLIPLLTLICSVMAWGTEIVVNDFATLKTQLSASGTADVVKLGQDITYEGTAVLDIQRSLTLDGQGHKLIGFKKTALKTDGTSEQHWTSIAVNAGQFGSTAELDVTIKNLSLGNTTTNARYYGIVAFDGVKDLTLKNINIVCSDYSAQQPLCFTGTSATPIDLTIEDSYIYSGKGAYPAYILKPINATMKNSTFEGYCALYFKYRASAMYGAVVGARGSVVNADACAFNAPNVHNGETNAFAVFPMEDDGITLNLNNCSYNAQQIGDQYQAWVSVQYRTRKNADHPITIKITGDNTHMYNINKDKIIDVTDTWKNGYASGAQDADLGTGYDITTSLTIEAGTFSLNPSTFAIEQGDGTVNAPFIDDTKYEINKVKQGDADLYRVTKKPAEKEPGVLYDLNDAVETAAEGENPVTSFELSAGEPMQLDVDREVTTAGYVQVKDNESTSAGTVVKVGAVVAENKVDQTLVINNGLDVQGNSKVEVQAGSALIIGEGGITTEDPENIIIEADEDGAASLLLDPAISVNQTPELTVKMTVPAEHAGYEMDGSGQYRHWHRFAMPVDHMAATWVKDPDVPTYLYGWDYANQKWAQVGVTQMVPFAGYTLSPDKEISTNTAVTYTFKGQLLGNTNCTLNLNHHGYNFFGNSYTGYISILKLVEQIMGDAKIDGTVWMWDGEKYKDVALANLAEREYLYQPWQKEVAPMQTFVLRLTGEDFSSTDINYADAIWGNPRYDAAKTALNAAPARQAEINDNAIISMSISANGQKESIVLIENGVYSDAYDRGYDAIKYMNENSFNTYVGINGENYGTVATDNLDGKMLSIKTNNELAYSMTFDFVAGEEYALRDNLTGNVIAIEEGATYEFAAQPNSTVEGRFEIIALAKVPTAIENAEVKANVKGIYTITGQYVGENFEAVPAGVYVVNGVKIVK